MPSSIASSRLNPADQRYFPRWVVTNKVQYQVSHDSQLREGWTRDISCAGACLIVKEELVLFHKLKLTIVLSEEDRLTLKAEVIWSTRTENEHLIGIIFMDVKDEQQELILQYAFQINKDRMVQHWFQGWND